MTLRNSRWACGRVPVNAWPLKRLRGSHSQSKEVERPVLGCCEHARAVGAPVRTRGGAGECTDPLTLGTRVARPVDAQLKVTIEGIRGRLCVVGSHSSSETSRRRREREARHRDALALRVR